MTDLRVMLASDSAKAKAVLSKLDAVRFVDSLEEAEFVLQDAGSYRTSQTAPIAMATRSTAPNQLTRRELEVLRMTAEGHSVRQVAELLLLSAKTVDAHKVNLMRKLQIHNKAHLVQYAFRNRILTLEEPSHGQVFAIPEAARC